MIAKASQPRCYFLPWPISTNAIWRSVNGRTILSEAARRWFRDAGEELMLQRPNAIKGPVEIEVALFAPTKRAYDPDNRMKVLFDALVKNGIIEDDNNRIIKQHAVTQITDGERGPGAYVTVFPVETA